MSNAAKGIVELEFSFGEPVLTYVDGDQAGMLSATALPRVPGQTKYAWYWMNACYQADLRGLPAAQVLYVGGVRHAVLEYNPAR